MREGAPVNEGEQLDADEGKRKKVVGSFFHTIRAVKDSLAFVIPFFLVWHYLGGMAP
jgi:hypothetical protein